MSLARIQNFMLNLVIDPNLSQRFFQDPKSLQDQFQLTDEELSVAMQMPKQALEDFQMVVAGKRLRRVESSIRQTLGLMSNEMWQPILRGYITENIMRTNQWSEQIPDFLTYISANLPDHRRSQVIRDVIAFEKSMHEFLTSHPEPPSGCGYMRSPHVSLNKVPFAVVEPLIADSINRNSLHQLVESHGKADGYVLALRTDEGTDLYEIDNYYYEFLMRCHEPVSWEDLLACAEQTAKQLQEPKTAEEMCRELLDLGILIQLGEGDQ